MVLGSRSTGPKRATSCLSTTEVKSERYKHIISSRPTGESLGHIMKLLRGGFGEEHGAGVLARERDIHDVPLAYRVRIVVTSEALTRTETDELLRKAKARKAER